MRDSNIDNFEGLGAEVGSFVTPPEDCCEKDLAGCLPSWPRNVGCEIRVRFRVRLGIKRGGACVQNKTWTVRGLESALDKWIACILRQLSCDSPNCSVRAINDPTLCEE